MSDIIYLFVLIINIVLFLSNCFLCGYVRNIVESLDEKLVEMQFLLNRVIDMDSVFLEVEKNEI